MIGTRTIVGSFMALSTDSELHRMHRKCLRTFCHFSHKGVTRFGVARSELEASPSEGGADAEHKTSRNPPYRETYEYCANPNFVVGL